MTVNERSAFKAADREVTLYTALNPGSPLIIFNNFEGDGSGIVDEMSNIGCGDCHLASIGGLNWDHDMTPWQSEALYPGQAPCTGGADEYLDILRNVILPEILSYLDKKPQFYGIAGYSLAGLFAVYSMYKTDIFLRVASMSGSLWFPGFREYVISHELVRKPEVLYLSLGNKEAKTRNTVLKTVQENTEFLAEYYREKGISVKYELNPGNHFKDAELRSAKGIAALPDR